MRYAALDASKLSVPSKKKNGTRCAVNAVDAVRDGLTSLWVLQSTKQVHECGQGGKEAVVSSSERREASASKAGAKGRANLRAVCAGWLARSGHGRGSKQDVPEQRYGRRNSPDRYRICAAMCTFGEGRYVKYM